MLPREPGQEEVELINPAASDFGPVAHEVLGVISDTIVRVDEDLRVRSVNRPHSVVFRKPAREGDALQDLLEEEAALVIKALINNAQVTGAGIAEHHTASDMFRVTARKMQTVPETLLVFENITGIRHAGQSLIDLIRYRNNFLTSISHELRAPLTAVIGYADMLSDPNPDLDEVARQSMVRDMTDQAWDLAGTVEDLLTVARAELGDLAMAVVSVNITANVAQVIESMGGRGSRVAVIGDPGISGLGDPSKFRQIIRNLLSNALAHGSEPVRVEISTRGGHAITNVIDSGAGLPEDLVASAFNQYTAGAVEGNPRGVGVGLWICRELASLMGGALSYRRENHETVFEVAIPLR